MNRNTLRALLADARYQVFDNVVFRILLGIAGLLVLLSFLVVFEEEQISMFFGAVTIPYSDFGPLVAMKTDIRAATIQQVQTLLIDVIAGTFGILLAIAATAFFTPRMLEKGSADNLFSKPVGRITLLFSRYLAGVFFVTVLSLVMVFGVQMGLSIMSDYNDWGFLWSAVTLIYVYSALQAFSILVATVTRSSVASILLTMMLFMFTGCANGGWVLMEYISVNSTDVTRESGGDEADEAQVEEATEDTTFQFFHSLLGVVRWTLPRTGDADMIARKLRRQVEGRPAQLIIEDEGKPVLHLASESQDLVFQGGGLAELDGDGLRWTLQDGGEVTLTRRVREKVESRFGDDRPIRSSQLYDRERDRIAAEHGEDALLAGTWVPKGKRIDWRTDDEQLPLHSLVLLTVSDFYYTLTFDLPEGSFRYLDPDGSPVDGTFTITTSPGEEPKFEGDSRGQDAVQTFLQGAFFGVDPASMNPEMWYENRFGWTAPVNYNAWVSIGVTVAFALVMLLLACWRLSRMDF